MANKKRHRVTGDPTRLAFPPSFNGDFEGKTPLARRDGGVPFNWWERLLIKLSFVFDSKGMDEDQDPIPPEKILEQLASVVSGCIERAAITSFEQTLQEMIRYHKFLLDLYNARDDAGKPMNFAELGDHTSFQPPHQEWIQLYRRLLEQASDKIDVDLRITKILSHLPIRLLPHEPAAHPDSVMVSILSLARLQVYILEKWFTRRKRLLGPEDGLTAMVVGLAGSDERAYKEILLDFVGAWESVALATPFMYGWRKAAHGSAEKRWAKFSSAMPFLMAHLRETAYFVASAVWNEDAMASATYQDALVRWSDKARADTRDDYHIPFKWMVLPDNLSPDWEKISGRLDKGMANHLRGRADPALIFDAVVRHAFNDVLIVSAAVMLGWYASEPERMLIAGETARAILFRELNDQGAAQRQRVYDDTPFRAVFQCILRSESDRMDGYGGTIDGLVSFLNGMTEGQKVSGRIYSGFSWHDRGSLVLQLIAILLGTMPTNSFAHELKEIDDLAADPNLSTDGQLVAFADEFRRILGELGSPPVIPVIERCVKILAPAPVMDRISSLQEFLQNGVDTIERRRTERVMAAPLDMARLQRLASECERMANTLPDYVTLHWDTRVEFRRVQSAAETWGICQNDRGDLTDPLMSRYADHTFEEAVHRFGQVLAAKIHEAFWTHQRIRHAIGPRADFWRTAKRLASRVGDRPTVFASPARTRLVDDWVAGRAAVPKWVGAVTFDRNKRADEGSGYVATLDGIDIFDAQIQDNQAVIYSGSCMETISYAPVDTGGNYVDVGFKQHAQSRSGEIQARVAMTIQWSQRPIIELVVEAPPMRPEDTPRPRKR